MKELTHKEMSARGGKARAEKVGSEGMRQLQRKGLRKALEVKLSKGMISQEGYNRGIAKLEAQEAKE